MKLLNRIYETRFCNDKLLVWTRNVGGLLFATRRYDIVTKIVDLVVIFNIKQRFNMLHEIIKVFFHLILIIQTYFKLFSSNKRYRKRLFMLQLNGITHVWS